MAKNLAPAKTPGVAVARILRGLGLKQGTDFGIRAERKNGERIGTRVAVFGAEANQTVADNADLIERLASEAGFHFNVSVYFTPSGNVWVAVANFGERTRQTHFLSATSAEPTEPAEDQPLRDRAVALADESMAEPFNPYAGLATRTVGNRVWGCGEAGQMWFFQTTEHGPRYTLRLYLGNAFANGWYLFGPGIGSDTYMAARFGDAAAVSNDVIDSFTTLIEDMERVAVDFPKGRRVQGLDNYGVTCMGTVNGVAWGAVTQAGHQNYGRTWVDVDWDEMPHNQGTGRRSRTFTSDLIKH